MNDESFTMIAFYRNQTPPPRLPSLEGGVLCHESSCAYTTIFSISYLPARASVFIRVRMEGCFRAIQKREQPNVPAFAASIPSATYHILDVVGLP